MIKRTSIASFLLRTYAAVAAVTIFITAILVIVNLSYQIRLSRSLISQRILQILELNQNDFLNEIVMSDLDALQEHVDLLAKQLDVDRVILETPGKGFISKKQLGRTWSPDRIDAAIIGLLSIPPFTYELKNYFGQRFGKIEIAYSKSVYVDTLQPMIKQAFHISAVVLCFFTILFLYMYARFVVRLARPLNAISAFLKGRGSLKRATAGIEEIVDVHNALIEYDRLKQNMEEVRLQAERDQIARQVAHDIKSPLATLEMASSNLPEISEEKRVVLRSALIRIQDIVNNLVERYRTPPTRMASADSDETLVPTRPATRTSHLLSTLIEEIISEKRVQYARRPEIRIEMETTPNSYGIFVGVDSSDFKRVLSNLINNSVEAISGPGHICLSIHPDDESIDILVRDTGKGIPPQLLPKIFNEGVTFDKEGGLGLGLYHAKRTIESWTGTITIDSTVGAGTTVTIRLPRAPAPEWFVKQIVLTSATVAVILDDDPSIDHVWRERFNVANISVKEIITFRTSEAFLLWFQAETAPRGDCLYLFDYELLGEEVTGLDLLKKLNLCPQAILVTNRCDEAGLQQECQACRLRLLSKRDVRLVPLSYVPELEKPDAIIIDDDRLVHLTWTSMAKAKGKAVRTFQTPNAFFEEEARFDRETPLYVDASLGDNIRGEEISRQASHHGFKNIYLATGHDPREFDPMPWLKGIVKKQPPWA